MLKFFFKAVPHEFMSFGALEVFVLPGRYFHFGQVKRNAWRKSASMAEGDALIIDEASREVIARLVAEKRRLLDAAPRLDAHRLHGDVAGAEPSAAPMATSSTFVRAARGAMADDCHRARPRVATSSCETYLG